MAAKRVQTKTEEEIEQILHDKSSKSTNKATDNAFPAGSFAVRDHLRSNLRIISGLGIIGVGDHLRHCTLTAFSLALAIFSVRGCARSRF